MLFRPAFDSSPRSPPRGRAVDRKREGIEGPSPPVELVIAQTRALNHAELS